MASTKYANVFEDPRQRQIAGYLLVAFLMFLAYLFRQALAVEGVLDTDVMNFGLAAFHFDVLQHQPHPPGYPGYVLYLKLIHLLAPWLGPIEVARFGATLCGLLLIPSTYWVCRMLLGDESDAPVGRPLIAATFSVLHPILWFYGGDGQSHSAEALLTVLLFGATVWVLRRDRGYERFALVVAFGLAGAVRPTIAALSFPLLVWAFWGRPLRDWAIAIAVGIGSVLLWYVPLVASVGGYDVYSRATKSLVGELFIRNYSIFSSEAPSHRIIHNVSVALVGGAIACIPILALTTVRKAWVRALLALIAVNIAFYATVYVAETGYLSGVAGVMCLVPSTWAAMNRSAWIRTALVIAVSMALVWFGPAGVGLYKGGGTGLPTYAK
jgi:hypothetical protein